MVAPAIAAAGITAGGSLLGAGLNAWSTNKANEANRPHNQVKDWEKAGINPLWGISKGQVAPQQPALFGDGIAQAAGAFGGAVRDGTEQSLRETQMRLQNQELQKRIDDLENQGPPSMFQTPVSGVPYGQNSAGSGGQANVTSDEDRITYDAPFIAGDTVGPVRPDDGRRAIFGSRDVETEPARNMPGAFILDNGVTNTVLGRSMNVLGDEGEPYSVGELIPLGVQMAGAIGKDAVKNEIDVWSGHLDWLGGQIIPSQTSTTRHRRD